MERTYSGPLGGGNSLTFDDGSTIRWSAPGVPVEVTAEQAAQLDKDPDWGGVEPTDDLDGLDKDALLVVAEDEGVEISNRWGETRIADTIRAARRGDDPSEED